MSAAGKLVGVGVGPGDPELITLKAVRVLEEADVVVHFAKSGTTGNARAIAERYLRPGIRELPLTFPVTTELPKEEAAYCDIIGAFYDAAACEVAAHLDAGLMVAVVCEGDPLFYGSYMHLHVRLAPRFHTEVVAGVSGMSGCWSAVGTPIAQGDDVFTVLPAGRGRGDEGRTQSAQGAARPRADRPAHPRRLRRARYDGRREGNPACRQAG